MLDFVLGFIIFLFVISVHEFTHAWVADRCGDPTARLQGRMTLDPRSHIDPIGTIFIPLSPLLFRFFAGAGSGFFGGFRFFGWAKPVPINPLKVRRWRTDNALISLAGPTSGFLVALTAAALLRMLKVAFPQNLMSFSVFVDILWRMGSISVWLSLFNLIPIPPLDGYHVLTELLRLDVEKSASFLRVSGPWLLLIVINTPFLYAVLGPAYAFLFGGLFRAIAGV